MKMGTPVLSEEEREVLVLVAQHPGDKHLTNEEIAQRLGVSVVRVKTLLHQACVKLGASNRNRAVLLAAKRGEISFAEVLSLDDLVDILGPLGPDVLRRIAWQMRQGQDVKGLLPELHQQIVMARQGSRSLLTKRERDVLVLVGRGLTNAEIADILCMTPSAVRTFLYRAFAKLGARKRADAVRLALRKREILIGDIYPLDDALQDLTSLGPESFERIAEQLEQGAEKRTRHRSAPSVPLPPIAPHLTLQPVQKHAIRDLDHASVVRPG